MKAKTIQSEQVWQSPDKQKTIWAVQIEAENKRRYELKTYSAKIAAPTFEGNIESYVNKRGERFIRQIPVKSTKPAFDTARDNNIRAQWAIGQAIAFASATMDKNTITMPIIERYAKDLFATVSRVKGETPSEADMQQAATFIRSFTGA